LLLAEDQNQIGKAAIVGGVTGPFGAPGTDLLGRFDGHGRLWFVGPQPFVLTATQQRELAPAVTRVAVRRPPAPVPRGPREGRRPASRQHSLADLGQANEQDVGCMLEDPQGR